MPMQVEIQFFDTALPLPPLPPESVHGLAGAWAEFRGSVRASRMAKKSPPFATRFTRPWRKKFSPAILRNWPRSMACSPCASGTGRGVVPVGEGRRVCRRRRAPPPGGLCRARRIDEPTQNRRVHLESGIFFRGGAGRPSTRRRAGASAVLFFAASFCLAPNHPAEKNPTPGLIPNPRQP